jgi:hypothetical protein
LGSHPDRKPLCSRARVCGGAAASNLRWIKVAAQRAPRGCRIPASIAASVPNS